MAGYSTSCCESGIVSKSSAGTSFGAGSEVSDVRPIGTRHKGDFRGNLAQATAMEPAVAHARATIICTGTYWRNAWKYQARTYRHLGWDKRHLAGKYAGHVYGFGAAGRDRARVRGRRGEPPARSGYAA